MRRRFLLIVAMSLPAQSSTFAGPETETCEPPDELDLPETGPARALWCIYHGRPCERVQRGAVGPGPDHPPGEGPANPGERWEASEQAVFDTCGGLGCVDDQQEADGQYGVCGIPSSVDDCAGVDQSGKTCGRRHAPLEELGSYRPKRFMFTASALIDSDDEDATGFRAGVLGGVLFQLALTSVNTVRMRDGGLLHYGLPSFYLHVSAFLGDDRAGHDVGLVYKTGRAWPSRLGVTFMGHAVDSMVEDELIYRAGPAIQVELYYNLILKGAWLMIGEGNGPQWITGVEYAADLLNDFKR